MRTILDAAKNLEQKIYPSVYHQSACFSRFLRIDPHNSHLLSGDRYHRVQNRDCSHRYVCSHHFVPPCSRVSAGQLQPLSGLSAVPCFVLPFFPGFHRLPIFGVLIIIRLYMGAVYSVCGSATMTLAGDVLPVQKITEGISRFAFTVSIGMAVGPYVGLQVQSHMSSKASFLTIFGISVAALICVSCCRIRYPKVARKKFSIRDSIYTPALPFMFNMMFLMIPYGAVIAYSSIFAQEKGLSAYLPYFTSFWCWVCWFPNCPLRK